MMQFH